MDILVDQKRPKSYPPFPSFECFLHKDRSSLGLSSISCFNKMSVKRGQKKEYVLKPYNENVQLEHSGQYNNKMMSL